VLAEGEGFELPADTVVTAIGEAIEADAVPRELTSPSSGVAVDAWGRTTLPNVFAGGDVTETPRTVAHALGAGKRAAVAIDRYLRARAGEPQEAAPGLDALRFGLSGNVSMARWRCDDPVARVAPVNEVVEFTSLNPASFARVARHPDRYLDGERAWTGFTEVNRGLTRETALAEARRCFNCGVCNQCDLCLILCPDVAISRSDGHYEIALDYCKGCGICAEECPRGALTMTRQLR
jgi:2-oxoacid:acceptor oxidoreductase delta subunit (pyruvate/2-ketoisovalerate family)